MLQVAFYIAAGFVIGYFVGNHTAWTKAEAWTKDEIARITKRGAPKA